MFFAYDLRWLFPNGLRRADGAPHQFAFPRGVAGEIQVAEECLEPRGIAVIHLIRMLRGDAFGVAPPADQILLRLGQHRQQLADGCGLGAGPHIARRQTGQVVDVLQAPGDQVAADIIRIDRVTDIGQG